MKYLIEYKSFFENVTPYTVNWTEPDIEYFNQELDEFFRTIKYSKNPGGYLHPANLKTMIQLIPKTLTRFAELVLAKHKELIPNHLRNIEPKSNLVEVLSNIQEDKLTKTDSGAFSKTLMALIPICEELKKDPECRAEGLKLFKMGQAQDWSKTKIKQTGHMGKISSFPEYNIKDTNNPKELLKLVASNKNLNGFLYNVKQFLKPGIIELPMPFVIKFPSGHADGKIYSCIGGHKRSLIAIQLGIPLTVWLIDLTNPL